MKPAWKTGVDGSGYFAGRLPRSIDRIIGAENGAVKRFAFKRFTAPRSVRSLAIGVLQTRIALGAENMAKFVVVLIDGKMEVELEAEPGEELTPAQVSAYSMMQAGSALAQISERLDDLVSTTGHIADAIEQKA